MKNTILVFGLPGAGKTTFSRKLQSALPDCILYDADQVRALYSDWDFTDSGRQRQAQRMGYLARLTNAHNVICDFVCPRAVYRAAANWTFIIFINTITTGRFENTNRIFELPAPGTYNIKVNSFSEFDSAIEAVVRSIIH